MKTKHSLRRKILMLVAALVLAPSAWVYGLPTVITYQGSLNTGGQPANGTFDLAFTLFDNSSGGSVVGNPVTNAAAVVSNGVFTVSIDFGASAFTGAARWLELAVRTNGALAFTVLAPRQQLTAVPYSLYAPNAGLAASATTANTASSVAAANISGTVSLSQLPPGVVTNIAGTADITASASGGTVVLGDNGTSTNVPNALVRRDSTGSFGASNVVLAGTLSLPANPIITAGGNRYLSADALQNTAVGRYAFISNTTGTANSAEGYEALQHNTTGSANTAVGVEALQFNTNGSYNTAVGTFALAANYGGYDNTANGYEALVASTIANDNTAIGFETLRANTMGNENTAPGSLALSCNTNGSYNTASGYGALSANVSGSFNTADGWSALQNNTTGFNNTANGADALSQNTTGYENVANGEGALSANTVGYENTAVGKAALLSNTTGTANTANGANALVLNTTGYDNVANGDGALYFNTVGYENTAVGSVALFENTIGSDNTAVGFAALLANTVGFANTALGYDALSSNTNGRYNIGIGHQAGVNISSGGNNIFIGNAGVNGDDSITRIGAPGVQTNVFVAGIYGASPSGAVPVFVNSAGQLGTGGTVAISQLASGVLTNGAANVTFGGGLTVNGQIQSTSGGFKFPDGTVQVSAYSGTASSWGLSGNSGTIPGVNFIGTADDQPMEIRVNGKRAARLEPILDGTFQSNVVNVVAGSQANVVLPGTIGATIAGGGAGYYWFGNVGGNTVGADFATIGGGIDNSIQTLARFATIAGGSGNSILPQAYASVIAGGENNTIQSNAFAVIAGGNGNTVQCVNAAISGGYGNAITGGSGSSTIGGGAGNQIRDSGISVIAGGFANKIEESPNVSAGGGYDVVGGGADNTIGTNAAFSTIPGGAYNEVDGSYSFGAGESATALHNNSFVWGDGTLPPTSSFAANSVTFRASGGYWLYSSAGAVGVRLFAGSGAWTSLSDRTAKENFQPVNTKEVLERVAALPITTWNYKSQQPDVRHIGPTAQDFKAAFLVGETDTGISAIDEQGVALAAIQGLDQKIEEARRIVTEKADEVQTLRRQNESLERRLGELELQIQHLTKTNE